MNVIDMKHIKCNDRACFFGSTKDNAKLPTQPMLTQPIPLCAQPESLTAWLPRPGFRRLRSEQQALLLMQREPDYTGDGAMAVKVRTLLIPAPT